MHSHKRSLAIMAAALLAASLVALTSPAVAAGQDKEQGKPGGFDYIAPRDLEGASLAAQDAAGPATKLSRLSVRLYGGFSRVAAGNINAGSDGYMELFKLYESLGYGETTGGYKPVHGGYDFGADVIYRISPMFGVGLGVGYLRSSRASHMTFTEGTNSLTMSATPALSAVPVRLAAFLTTPLSRKIDLIADAGAAWYAGLKFEGKQRIEAGADSWSDMTVSGSRSSLSNLGFQGSLGVEYRFTEKLGFFVEALGRYARFKNFAQVTGAETTSGGSDTVEGKLYVETVTFIDGSFSMFTIEETPPTDSPSTTYREPKIDLSGFSIQAGVHFRF